MNLHNKVMYLLYIEKNNGDLNTRQIMLTFILFNHNSNIYPTFLKCFSNLNLTRHDLGCKRPTPTDTKHTLSSSVWYKNNPLWDQMFASEYTPSHQWKQITKCDWVLIL